MQTEEQRARKYYWNQKYKNDSRQPCVYLITNRFTGEQYVGCTVNLRQRMFAHWCELRGDRHHSESFIKAFKQYGKSAFEVSVLEYPVESMLYQREYHYIKALQPAYNGRR